jgi:predicted DNA-binding transcriptional regulator AlpA
MQTTTVDIFRSGLKADPSVSPAEAKRILALIVHNMSAAKPENVVQHVARLIRRREAAQRLSCSLRTIDKLASSGVLTRRKFPGRKRASGFLESEVVSLIGG